VQEWESELDDTLEISEKQSEQIYIERLEEIKIQIEQDEYPLKPTANERPERKQLKRELQAEALTHLEDAARTEDDFQKIVDWWNRLDENRERRERYHEVLRNGDNVPLDYGAVENGMFFPDALNCALEHQIRKGDFLDAIFYCPYELHELVTDAGISAILKDLTEDQKELLFLWAVRLYSSSKIAAI